MDHTHHNPKQNTQGKTFHSSPQFIIFDAETTGFYLEHDMIKFACIIAGDSLNVISKAVFTARPLSPTTWSFEAERIHGITYQEAQKFPSLKETMSAFIEYLASFTEKYKRLTFVYHAIGGFDWRVLEHSARKVGLQFELMAYIDPTNKISTIQLGKKAGYAKNGLDVWAKRVNYDLKHHDPESDVECTRLVFKYLRDKKGQVGLF